MTSTNLGERKTNVIILPLQNNIQPNQFNFIRLMQRQTGFKIKTINMDCDIFTQEKIHHNKYTVPLIRSLTQRKNHEYRKGKDQSQKLVGGETEQENNGETMENSPDKVETDANEGLYQNFKEGNNDFLKRHTKTNPSHHKKQPYTERRPHFKRYNHSYSHSIQAKHEDPELFFESFHKGSEEQAQHPKQDSSQSPPRPQDKLKVNPYTKDQYIYMRNRQLDQLMQLKRSAKLTRMNSITKSYRVATINLTPQTTRRANSFRMAMPNIPNKSKNSPFANAAFLRSTKKQSQIKPWEWVGPEESKQYLI